jgi:hypothetical protein
MVGEEDPEIECSILYLLLVVMQPVVYAAGRERKKDDLFQRDEHRIVMQREMLLRMQLYIDVVVRICTKRGQIYF